VRRVALALVIACLAASAAVAADLRRVEAMGAVPVDPKAAAKTQPRTLAVRAAVARAVEQVAQELAPDAPKPAKEPSTDAKANPAAIAPELARALGTDPLDYATRYRILEDRGLRAVSSPEPGGAEKEYEVMVEVQVDATHVAERLRAAGWIASLADASKDAHVQLVLENVRDYRALASVRRLLVEKLGARRALPVEFRRGGEVVLAVEGGPSEAQLAAALQAAAPPELHLSPAASDHEGVALLVEWTPPAPAPTSAPADPDGEGAASN
jgi:hypothetical protein